MKKNISGTLVAPKDIIVKEYNVTIIGSEKMFIEGFESIRELSSKEIKLKVKKGFLNISGENLVIEYFDGGEILITGKIRNLVLV